MRGFEFRQWLRTRCHAHDAHLLRTLGDLRNHGGRIGAPHLQGEIEAVVGFCDVKVCVLAFAQQRMHQRAQFGGKGEQFGCQHMAFVHIHDGVRGPRIEADFDFAVFLGGFQRRAAPCFGGDDDWGVDGWVFDAALGQRLDHQIAFEGAIGLFIEMLQGAAAAGAEVAADRRCAVRARRDDFGKLAIFHAHHIAGGGVGHEAAIFGDAIACVTEFENAKRRAQAMRLRLAASCSRPNAPRTMATMPLESRPAASYIFSGVS